MADTLEIEPGFEKTEIRRRRKKRQFDYEAPDEPVDDPKQNYKVNFYFAILDVAIQSIDERFHQLNHYSSLFGFLYDIHEVSDKPTEDVLSDCKSLEKLLEHEDKKDIDAEELCSELQAIARRLPTAMHPQAVLEFLLKFKLLESFPNVAVALRVLLTLPVSVASGERSFSKLKLIKTYLRSTTLQERLVGLATISIEHDLAFSVSTKDLANLQIKRPGRLNFNCVHVLSFRSDLTNFC